MSKYYGAIGYAETVETSPGIWTEEIVERNYYGDIQKNNRRLEGSTEINENIVISNTISIMADAYAQNHFFDIRYIKWLGVKWTVKSIEVQSPRLILTVGGK